MSVLIIKNLGPIKEIELDVKRVTMIIGPQSSGKSTIGKILCHCQWIEKRCFINLLDEAQQQEANFLSGIEEYYRMGGYFSADSYIKYEGPFVTIEYENKKAQITIKADKMSIYQYPKLCYIPASRNFAAMIPNVNKYNESNDLLMYFIYDWTTARDYVKKVQLGAILQKNIEYIYNKEKKDEDIKDGKNRIKLQNASSGVQSLIPLYIVASYLLDGIYKRIKPLSPEQKNQLSSLVKEVEGLKKLLLDLQKKSKQEIDLLQKKTMIQYLKKLSNNPLFNTLMEDVEGVKDSLSRKFFYKLTSLFIEEPEQNLFPDAQEKLLYWLISYMLVADYNHSLYLTTHSPYLLFALNNCIMGSLVKDKLPKELQENLSSKNSWISPSDVSIYQIADGTLIPIQDKDGLLQENYLNDAYRKNSSEYLSMLTYYDA